MHAHIPNPQLETLIKHVIACKDGEVIEGEIPSFDILQRHRIDGVFSSNYLEANCSLEFLDKLQKTRQKKIKRQLNQIITLKTIVELFDANNIEFLIFKGVPLCKLLYNNLEARYSRDIDVLVKPNRVKEVYDLFLANGFSISVDNYNVSEENWGLFISEFDQATFRHDAFKVQIEIHWKLFRDESYFTPSEKLLWSESQIVETNGVQIPVPSNEVHAIYVALHGAQHQWDSLVWVLDMYYFQDVLTNEELERSISIAKKYNVLETYVLGFYIAKLVFGLQLKPLLLEHLNKKVTDIGSDSLIFLSKDTSKSMSAIDTFKKMSYSLKLNKGLRLKLHHIYRIPIYSLKHLKTNRKFVHWSLRPLIQLKERSKR